jgi:hypothetical protein
MESYGDFRNRRESAEDYSSTRISDLPDNITMTPFSESHTDRASDMASASYRQMNPHQNPFVQGQPRMDAMPPPQANRDPQKNLAPPAPPSYDMDRGPLGQAPQFPLPQRDIPMDTAAFRDEAAKPNYVPPVAANTPNYVKEQESILREKKIADSMKRAIDGKFDILAEFQIPLLVSILFWIFQMDAINRLFSKYLKFAGLFGEDGVINGRGILVKSALFGAAYYGVLRLMELAE